MNATVPSKRLSIGLCIINAQGNILGTQRSQDDLLWQMPEFPVEIETDLSLALNSAIGLLLPDVSYTLLSAHDEWLTQEIPDYIAKKEGLTGATSEQEKWFVLRLNQNISTDQINKNIYIKAQWVTKENLLTLIMPHKRLTYTTVIQAFDDYISIDQGVGLKADFKSESQAFSKKTRQDS